MGMLQIAGQIKLAFGVSIHKDVFLPRVSHYHLERNHQGLDNRLLSGSPVIQMASRVRRRPRLGGLLNYYERAA